jgi:ATP-dependent Lon protease
MVDDQFVFEELDELKELLDKTSGMPGDLRHKAERMLQRLDRMAKLGHYSQDFDTISRYIETLASIPWDKRTEDKLDLVQAKKMLDKNHYGMEGVKEMILEYLAAMILIKRRSNDPSEAIAKSPVLLLVGLQGVGKTTIAISIAEALERKFVRIPMGGIGSPLAIRGRSKSYPESEPGLVMKGVISAGVKNPVILLDEIEKTSGDEGLSADIFAILLEILDPSQNHSFRDHYIDFPYDLSECLFICSANNLGKLTAALLDRMQVVKMPSYTDNEKIVIARDYLLPGILKKTGLNPGELEFDPDLWPGVVRPFGYDTGIRSLGRTLEGIARKVAKEIVEEKVAKVYINADNLKKYLPQA